MGKSGRLLFFHLVDDLVQPFGDALQFFFR